MNNLQLNTTTTMSSREIAEMTGKQHKDVLKKIRSMFADKISMAQLCAVVYINENNREMPEFLLPELESKMLVATMDIAYLEQITEYWINRGEQPEFKMLTHVEALELAVEQAKKIERDRPKLESFDKFTADDEGKDMNSSAKCLNWGRNKMMAELREAGILLKDNTAAQRYVEAGYFKLIMGGFWTHPTTEQRMQNIKTRMTRKGAAFIARKFNKELNWEG